MFSFFKNAALPIGIDAGSHSVRLLQFRHADAGSGDSSNLALQGACRIELASLASPAGGWGEAAVGERARILAAVEQALSAGGEQHFLGKRVALSLPVTAVQAKSVRLPQMPDSDLSQALQWEAKDRFGFDVGDNAGQLVWFRAGEVRRGTEVKDELLLFAISGETVNNYIQGLSNLGLSLTAIDLAPCAAYRAVYRASPPAASGETAALLDMGHRGSQLMITRDGEMVFYKHIDIGGQAINAAIASKLGISSDEATQMRLRLTQNAAAQEESAPLAQALKDAIRGPLEELARELDMCMRYYVVTFRGARPLSINITGRQAGSVEVHDVLSASLGLQVNEAQALRGVQDLGDAARPDRSGEWAVAAGLSLYPAQKDKPKLEAAA